MNRRLLIAAGVCVALVLAWFQFSWTPKGEELRAAHHRNQVAQDQAGELRVRLARLRSAQRDLPKLEAARDRLRTAVPDDAELADFLLQANDAATKAGVDYLSIAPTPPSLTNAGLPADVRLAINVKGGYQQLLDYLDRLYALPRVVVLDNVQVSPDASGGAQNLSVTLGGRMFTTQVPATGTTPPPATGSAPAPSSAAPASPTPAATTPTTGATR